MPVYLIHALLHDVCPVEYRQRLEKYENLKNAIKKTTGPFLTILWGVNRKYLYLLYLYSKFQPIKINIKKVSKSVNYPYLCKTLACPKLKPNVSKL